MMGAGCIWFTGFSGSGKTTIANTLAARVAAARGEAGVLVLDGDVLRRTVSADLGYAPADRATHNRRVAQLAQAGVAAGKVVIVALISPFAADRDHARVLLTDPRFLLVWLSTSLETCRRRDVKGLYRQVAAGAVSQFTGISSPYEPPTNADLVLDTEHVAVAACVQRLLTVCGARWGTVG